MFMRLESHSNSLAQYLLHRSILKTTHLIDHLNLAKILDYVSSLRANYILPEHQLNFHRGQLVNSNKKMSTD